jgi:FAD/FMN-containing dehydrogenase
MGLHYSRPLMSDYERLRRILAEGASTPTVLPGDERYERARRVWNGRIDRHPLAIVFAQTVEDVRSCIIAAHDAEVPLFVRGGGHSVAGSGVGDGLVVDVSALKWVDVHPAARTIRTGSGLTWGDLDRATQRFGLAVPGGTDSEVGVAGLSLGGGNGWLMGAFGATVDSMAEVEVVTADGELRKVSATEEPDLFWALRGGGGNFGVATSFTYRLHPVGPRVVGGMISYPWSKAQAALALYRRLTESAPDELTAFACLLYLGDAPVVGVALCWCGDPDNAGGALASLAELEPVDDQIGSLSFVELQSMMDAARPAGRRCAMRSHFMAEIGDDAIQSFVDGFAECPSPLSVSIIEHCHGAISRVPVSATAFALRDSPFHVEHIAFWDDPSATNTNMTWVEDCYRRTARFGTREVYLNSLDEGEGERVPEAYGPNYARLRKLKGLYDPDNFFRGNHNIAPPER